MNRKYFAILALLFIIPICGCTAKFTSWPPQSLQMCKDFEDFPKKIGDHSKGDCYTYWAVNKSDASLCDNIEFGGRASCIRSVAYYTKNLSLCELLTGDDKKSCIDKVNCELKPVECGISRCKSQTSYDIDMCLRELAIHQNNLTVCNYEEDWIGQTNCVSSYFTGKKNISVSLCDQLNGSKSRDNCLYIVGVDNKNSSICQQIKDENFRNDCLKYSGK